MKKMTKTSSILLLVVGLVLPLQAADGLQAILASEGLAAFGQAVKAEAEQIMASGADETDVIGELIEMLNSVAGFADEEAVRYAMIAVMAAAGPENMELAEAAISGSELAVTNGMLAQATMSDVRRLLGGNAGQQGGDDQHGGDDQRSANDQMTIGGGEEEDPTVGGGQDPLFPRSVNMVNPFAPTGLLGDDQDAPATPI